MVEPANIHPEWKESAELTFFEDDEQPRAVAQYKDGWLVSTYSPDTKFSRIYYFEGMRENLK